MRTQDRLPNGVKNAKFPGHNAPILHPRYSMARPYWTGQISLSLVSFAVEIYPAVTSARPFQFHQIDRATGERIHYQNVAADGDEAEESGAGRSRRGSLHIAGKGHGAAAHDGEDQHVVEKSDIVKGYEYEKGKYAIIEPGDLKRLRIPGKDTLEIAQFSSAGELTPSLYVKPYFVVPKKGPQATAFAVVRQAMMDTGMVGLGEIAFAGREHVVALAPPPDRKQLGMMLYVLRFAEELRDPAEYFGKIPPVKLNAAQLELAKQLIKTYTHPLELDKFTDNYEEAVRELVEAKLANKPLPREKPAKTRGKVVDLMSALRQSLAANPAPKSAKQAAKVPSTPAKRKLKLVAGKRRKTA
ncbi:MAG TPA: Ku protein [Acidobacteriaceae bacterium]|nr:Ku protein [Acidobacteriaceae bacterium]